MQQSDDPNFEQQLASARNGDAMAVEELLERYRNYLGVLARVRIDRRLQAKFDESDVVQETMIQANHDFRQFRGTTEATLTKWLRTIMSSRQALLTRRYFGRACRDPQLEQRLQRELDDSSTYMDRALMTESSSPSDKVSRREHAVLLADALSRLSDHYRQVIILHHVEGRTLVEAAQLMDRSVASVKKLWARAMVRLRQLMQGYE
jgi:RNA polymerase sigma-70 factor (ECF subfamily)